MSRLFYRVCNIETKQGLWYNQAGDFTGLIHDRYNFCMHNALKMNFDPEIVGWLSATDDLQALYQWFPVEDIHRLQQFGYFLHEYHAKDIRFYERFQHLIINQATSIVGRRIIFG